MRFNKVFLDGHGDDFVVFVILDDSRQLYFVDSNDDMLEDDEEEIVSPDGFHEDRNLASRFEVVETLESGDQEHVTLPHCVYFRHKTARTCLSIYCNYWMKLSPGHDAGRRSDPKTGHVPQMAFRLE